MSVEPNDSQIMDANEQAKRKWDARLCGHDGQLNVCVDEATWAARAAAQPPAQSVGVGRELFAMLRLGADDAEKGGSAMLAAAGL